MTAVEPWADFLTFDLVIARHAEVLAADGGLASPPKPGCVEGSLGAAWNAQMYRSPGGADVALDGLAFAGYLLFYLAKNHCFADGNKRTAFAAMHEVLARRGVTIEATEDELVDLVVGVAGGEIKLAEDVVSWIAQRLVELR